MTTEKVAVTVDRELLADVEKLRGRTGESRSSVFNRAIRSLLRSQDRDAKVRRYVAAYRELPETPAEIELAEALSRESLKYAPPFSEKAPARKTKGKR